MSANFIQAAVQRGERFEHILEELMAAVRQHFVNVHGVYTDTEANAAERQKTMRALATVPREYSPVSFFL